MIYFYSYQGYAENQLIFMLCHLFSHLPDMVNIIGEKPMLITEKQNESALAIRENRCQLRV